MQDKHGLLTDPISDVLRKMTLPMVFGIVAILLMNLVDAFFISLLGTEPLAAVSFTFPVTFGLNSLTMGVGLGISTFVGRFLGQGDSKTAARFSSHGILLAVLLVICVSSLGIRFHEPLFLALGATPDLLPLIEQYMHIWFLAIPLLTIPMTGNAAIRASGDTKTPSQMMMFAALVNAILDPILIFGYLGAPKLGIQGAAIASAISWGAALVWSLSLLIKREKLLKLPSPKFLIQDWKQILHISLPAAISNSLVPISNAILMKLVSAQGVFAVAAYGAAQRVESLLIIVLMALTSALTPFLAQNLGAKNIKRCFDALFLCMRFSILFQILIFIMMVPLSTSIAGLFSQEIQVQDLLWLYLMCVPISYGFQGVVMVLVSALNALHQPSKAFLWSCLRLFAFTLPCAWVGAEFYGEQGLFVGIGVGNILAGVAGYLYALQLRKQADSLL
ncbi:multi antimicrobial extrusion protein [Vibrio ishigakensis]|uniref:Multidrug resistance protein NorM n=1 Tax=Vibrio ishigakensis TaxID=1481914 RepID=A0A0B8NWA2_9VIBR|nr:MATE family efflux transporter [Vibrio ishigakensis]GAM55373.1 multi antimicrobial extrusion protein [Vibrio ishigakensis]